MDNYQIKIDVEPVNDYNKAKLDVMKAMISVRKLPQQQQQALAEEFFGAANVAAILKLFYQAFGRLS